MHLLLLALLALAGSAWAGEKLTLAEALAQPTLRCAITGTDAMTIAVQNLSDLPTTVAQPVGLIFAAGEDRVITLRAAELTVPARQAAEVVIPCARLSSRTVADAKSFRPTAESEPRVAGLLAYFASRNDVPRMTAQLLVLCVTEDVTFAQWRRFLGAQAGTEPAPQEVVAAIDALGTLREIHPARTFALASDAELKLRALRNPVARRKAMQLYGIALPDAPLPPELGTLLHTKPGDNCPICRQRALMQPRDDGL
jgi:hypothetical protein